MTLKRACQVAAVVVFGACGSVDATSDAAVTDASGTDASRSDDASNSDAPGCGIGSFVATTGTDPSRIELGDPTGDLALSVESLTVEFWSLVEGDGEMIVGTRGPPDGDSGYQVRVTGSEVRARVFGVFGHVVATPTRTGWHHVAWTLDDDRSTLWVDGVAQPPASCLASTVSANSCIVGNVATARPRPSMAPIDIGVARDGELTITDSVAGGIDELRFSSLARYDGDFTAPRTQSSDASTVALFRFNEASGAILSDEASQHSGVLIGTASFEPDDGFGGLFCD